MLGPILLIVFIAAILILFRKQIFATAGEKGEMAVAIRLSNLPKNDYFVINDLLFRRQNGRTSQIDHVVVSRYGIFVIETKNIFGYIYGGEYSQTWTRFWQGYARGGRYQKDVIAFDNPVLQNGAHVKALYEELKQYSVLYVPIVAFSPKAELRVDVKGVPVVYWNQIGDVIKRYKEPCKNRCRRYMRDCWRLISKTRNNANSMLIMPKSTNRIIAVLIIWGPCHILALLI